MEKNHHFTGRKFKARDWMNQYFTQEDGHLSMQTFRQLPEIARLLRQIPETHKHRALFFFLLYKYTDFDLDQPFQEQYETKIIRINCFLRGNDFIIKEDYI